MSSPAAPFQSSISRRDALAAAASIAAAIPVLSVSTTADALDFNLFAEKDRSSYQPAKRPLVYRVDSTIPPTLLPVRDPRQTLRELGQGSGTDKKAVVIDTVNLNNMLNKAVFGTIKAVQRPFAFLPRVSPEPSAVCLGLPLLPAERDVRLALALTEEIFGARPQRREPQQEPNTALGLMWAPYETQDAMDEYARGDRSLEDLRQALQQAGVPPETVQLYAPVLEYVRQAATPLTLLALAPSARDVNTVMAGGLQALDGDRRSLYVADPEGFIQTTTDPAFRLYTDRSLLKPEVEQKILKQLPESFNMGNLFAKRILIHEAAATKVAQFAAEHSQALVVVLAPMSDVRYQLGMNGRIPRIHNLLTQQRTQQNDASSTDGSSSSGITTDRVTTILLNPTAEDTLSKSKRLRLEIGTAPENLDYQQKIADYLWFSEMPRVSLIPRLMNG